MSEPAPPTPIRGRAETVEEVALRQWFAKEQLASVDNLEKGGREIIALTTTLLGLLFGLLALGGAALPAYLDNVAGRLLGFLGVIALLTALVAALYVVYPRPWRAAAALPAQQQAVFARLLGEKAEYLKASLWAFAIGVGCFGGVVVVALLVG